MAKSYQSKPTTQEKFRVAAKLALLHRRLTVTALAAILSRPRNSVSMAINRGIFPKVRAEVADELAITA